ncbi:class E sortase [Amycolatopsis endophytica]|uniref:Sortase A n=1 Tax=Amycolatopsis endophytica TaxID=860233 RepID=A0A853B4Z8_9PSEU|nr:sortase [Amycolatopsis endophytica]NYI90119.1 sortase A [Amycolatopsis endophytica]
MSTLSTVENDEAWDEEEQTETVLDEPVEEPAPRFATFGPKWIAGTAVAWVLTTALCFVLVTYALGPMLANNDQRAALADLKGEIAEAYGATRTLLGAAPVTKPPEFGSPVAILEIPKLNLQQVVLEGVTPEQTASGAGHVPGTSRPGQAGNSGIVGRYSGYGAPFSRLGELAAGDQIVVATTQGKSVYTVTGTATREFDEDGDYGKSQDDRLTLVTSASWWPGSASSATVVTAVIEGKPFRPTPQNGRADAQDGRTGDPSAWAQLVLAFGGFVAVAAGATLLYRRWRPVSTYVVTTPALLVLAVLAATAVWRLLPAWA